jgi:hypothetical protein
MLGAKRLLGASAKCKYVLTLIAAMKCVFHPVSPGRKAFMRAARV